jgi:putative peptidoglycan lipid II flippase
MIAKLFNSRTKTVASAAGLLGISALISRFLGLIRDRLLAGTFGAGEELDIYFAAFRIPDFVYGILIMGGVAAVFLPVFSEYFRKSEEDAWKFTNNLLNCFLVLLVLLCAILALLTPWLVNLIAPGFSQAAKELTVALTRIMFISPILFGISSVFSGVLHYFDRFLAYSFAPVVYNLGIIFGILFLVPSFGLYGLAYGVILGAALHWLFQIPAARHSGYRYLPLFNFKNFGLVKIFRLMVPRTIGAAAYHINLMVITAVASTLSAGSIAIFNLANNLQYFPVGLIGVSFSVAAFPALARSLASDLKEEFSKIFSSTFRQIIFLVIPVSFLIFILRAQIVRIVLGTGQFGWLETRLTAASLALFSLGIFAAALVPFLARVFYSFQDTKTPLAVGLISMVLNVGLCFLFVFLLGFANSFQGFIADILKLQGIQDIAVIGLPLALSISGIVQLFLLLFFLGKKEFDFNAREIVYSLKRILLASLLMAAVAYSCLFLTAELLDTKTFAGILIQTIIACLGAAFAYLLAGVLLKSPEIGIVRSSLVAKFKKR